MILVLLLYSLCASSFTIAKAVLSYGAPIFFVAVRMLLGGTILLGSYYVLYRKKIAISKKDMPLFFLAMVFHIYIAYIFDLIALQYITSFKSSFFFNLSPFFTAILSYFILGHTLTRNKVIGMLIGFVGFLPVLMQDAPQEGMTQLLFFSRAELYMLICVISSVYGWILVRQLIDRGHELFIINGMAMVGGGLMALITSACVEQWAVQSPVYDFWPFITLTLLVIVICNIAFYNLYGSLLKTFTPTFLSFAGFTTPLFAALFGSIFLGERPSWAFYVSSCIVGIGIYLFYREELKKDHVHR